MKTTKYSALTNQQLINKLAELTSKQENGRYYFEDPEEAAATLQEAGNRIKSFDSLKKLFERPAYTQMSLDLTANFELELNLKVKN